MINATEFIKNNMDYLLAFVRESDFSYEVVREQLRALWTAMALQGNLDPDTAEYDNLERRLYEAVNSTYGDGFDGLRYWNSYDEFSNFLACYLV